MYRLTILTIFFLTTITNVAFSQNYTITQNITGANRTDIRGQVFKPSEQGEGSGEVYNVLLAYLLSIEVVYASETEAPELFIYSELPADITSLDNGSGGTLVGVSTGKSTNSIYTTYHFDHLQLDRRTTYYALFKQDVQLEYGASTNVEGPYAGGKMLYNSGTTVEENDYTAIRFVGTFSNIPRPNQDDVATLIAIYNATGGPNWNTSWDLESDPYSWYGVDWSLNGRIGSLNLRSNNLTGTIPPEIGNLSVWDLDLSFNRLHGSIPPEIGNLEIIGKLDLRSNALSGTIPPEVGNLTRVFELLLSDNMLEGSIPPEIANMSELRWLYLAQNKFTGSLPLEMNNSMLAALYIYENSLSGIACDLNSWSNIHSFDVGTNQFDFGDFEPFVDMLTSLRLNRRIDGQKKIPLSQDTIVKELGESHVLKVDVAGTNNQYEWFKDGESIQEATSDSEYVIDSIAESSSGTYYCKVTNTTVPWLTMYTEDTWIDYQLRFNEKPFVTEINSSSVVVQMNINKENTISYVAVPFGSTPPSYSQVRKARDASDEEADIFGQITLGSINFDFEWEIKGLDLINKDYSIYFALEDESNTYQNLELVDVHLPFEFETPTLESVQLNEVTIALAANKTAQVFYLVVVSGSTPPSTEQIIEGSGTSEMIIIESGHTTITTGVTTSLNITNSDSKDSYEIYVVAKDNTGEVSSVHNLSAIISSSSSLNYDLQIYPNPTEGQFNIDLGNEFDYSIYITDTQGVVIFQETNIHGLYTIDLTNYKKGVYILRVNGSGGNEWVKLIKK